MRTHSFLIATVLCLFPLALHAQELVVFDIPDSWRDEVEASTGTFRFYEDVLSIEDNTVTVYATSNFKPGRLFYLVDDHAGETEEIFRVVGVVELAQDMLGRAVNERVALRIRALALASVEALQGATKHLVVMTPKTLALRRAHRESASKGGAVLSAQLWWAMMHGAVKDDLLKGFFYGVSAAGRYKRMSLGADLVFNVLDRKTLAGTGKSKELSILLLGIIKGQINTDWSIQSSGTWGKLSNDNGKNCKMYWGDLMAVYRWTDYVMNGFGYRFTQVRLPQDPKRSRTTYNQHMLYLGLFNPQLIGYSEPGVSWMYDLQFGFGGTDRSEVAGFVDGRLGLLYTYSFFRAKLGYRGLINFVGRKKTDENRDKSGPEFYLLTHGPYLEISFIL